MDFYKALQELHQEKKRLDAAIYALERRLATTRTAKEAQVRRRGRRSMSPEERLEVSARMSRYWAARRGVPVEMKALAMAANGAGS